MNTLTPSIAATVIAFCFAVGYAEAARAEPVKNIGLVHGEGSALRENVS